MADKETAAAVETLRVLAAVETLRDLLRVARVTLDDVAQALELNPVYLGQKLKQNDWYLDQLETLAAYLNGTGRVVGLRRDDLVDLVGRWCVKVRGTVDGLPKTPPPAQADDGRVVAGEAVLRRDKGRARGMAGGTDGKAQP